VGCGILRHYREIRFAVGYRLVSTSEVVQATGPQQQQLHSIRPETQPVIDQLPCDIPMTRSARLANGVHAQRQVMRVQLDESEQAIEARRVRLMRSHADQP
jgi:tRNA U38,U39,U40 pseudouridine synthase TruA